MSAIFVLEKHQTKITATATIHQIINVRHLFLKMRRSIAIPALKKSNGIKCIVKQCFNKMRLYPNIPANGQLKKVDIAVVKIAKAYCF